MFELLKYCKYESGENIAIAKGKYKLAETLSEGATQIANEWRSHFKRKAKR
jgi:hypothetical protein